MPNGFGRGFGFRGGMGFGFRGSSPPWPYIGLGRGGLPRCGYFFSGVAGAPVAWPYQPAPYPAGPGFGAGQTPYPFYPGATMETVPGAPPTSGAFAPQMTPEQEFDFLRNQAQAMKGQLEQIEARMRELETKE